MGSLTTATTADFAIRFPVTMRATPAMTCTNIASSIYVSSAAISGPYATTSAFYNTSVDATMPRVTVSGYTAGQACIINTIVAGAAFMASAEL